LVSGNCTAPPVEHEAVYAMAQSRELTWDEAMRRAHQAVTASERLYEDIDALVGRSNTDIEKHLRRAEVKASHAQVWVAIAQAIGTQGDRY
jgi:predicted transcriptional regulator